MERGNLRTLKRREHLAFQSNNRRGNAHLEGNWEISLVVLAGTALHWLPTMLEMKWIIL